MTSLVTKRVVAIQIMVNCLSFSLFPSFVLAQEGTPEQEQQEHSSVSATKQAIEATEEKVLGHDKHQQLEFLDTPVERHLGIIEAGGVVIIIGASYVLYATQSRKKRKYGINEELENDKKLNR